MGTTLQAVRGMNDVLPDEAPLWEHFEDTARSVFVTCTRWQVAHNSVSVALTN